MIHVPDDWSSGQALLVTSFLDDLVVAIWQRHGAAMGRALRAYTRLGLPSRRRRAPTRCVPGHWEPEEAFHVVAFLEQLVEAIWVLVRHVGSSSYGARLMGFWRPVSWSIS